MAAKLQLSVQRFLIVAGVLTFALWIFINKSDNQFKFHRTNVEQSSNLSKLESCFNLSTNLVDRFIRSRSEKTYNTVFQPIGVNGSLTYIYSAYVDDRNGALDVQASSSKPVVRLLAYVNRQNHMESKEPVGNWRCLLWNDDFRLIKQTPVLSCTDLNLFGPYATLAAPVMMTCRFPVADTAGNQSIAKYISLVSTLQCHTPRNLLPLVDMPAVRRAKASRDNRSSELQFVVCPRPLFHGNVLNSVNELVEFIEVNRMFGVELFHVYIERSALPGKTSVQKCIEQYKQLGVIETTPWSLPADIQPYIPWNGQLMTITDCLYRMMYRSNFVVHVDFDEFIVPYNTSKWQSMLESVDKKEAGKAKHSQVNYKEKARSSTSVQDHIRVASYSFRNRFFPMDWRLESAPDALQNELERHTNGKALKYQQFRTIGRVKGERRLFPWGSGSKVIVRPEHVLLSNIHEIGDEYLVPVGQRVVNGFVEEEDGVLHHYRWPNHNPWADSANFSRLRDFAPEIIRRLNDGLRLCNAES